MESEDENVAAIKGSAMVYCTECGFANEQGNAFCSQCGSPLEQPEANPAAPASPEPPAGRPGVDHTKAVVIVLIALICVVALVIGLFITHSMGLWGAQPQAQTSAQSTGPMRWIPPMMARRILLTPSPRPRRTRLIAPKTRTATIRPRKLDGEVEAFHSGDHIQPVV